MRASLAALDLPGGRARVRPEAEEWVRAALAEGRTLFEEARGNPDRIELRGRGPAYAIPAPVGTRAGGTAGRAGDPGTRNTPAGRGGRPVRWLVRHYRRGGAVASLLGDRYLRLGTPRPFRELAASEEVRARGVETPRVMAATVYPAGAFYRGDLVTEFVEGARDLAEILFSDDEEPSRRRRAAAAAGALVGDLAEAGVHHRDLNAKNVLLVGEGEALRALVLDLDRCRLAAAGTAAPRGSMLERLLRSLGSFEADTGRDVRREEREALVAAAREGG